MGWAEAEVEVMYRAFANYGFSYHVPWVKDREREYATEIYLNGLELRTMTESDLWAAQGQLDFDEECFKAYLPRILELYANDETGEFEIEFWLSQMATYTPFGAWPIGERGAFEMVVTALWLRNLEEYPGRWPGGKRFLEHFVALFDGDWFFTPWLHYPELPAVRHLAKFIWMVEMNQCPAGGSWSYERLADSRIKRALEAAFDVSLDDEIAAAFDRVDRLPGARPMGGAK